MGLALPSWVVDAKNNYWVLGGYAVLFAGILPYLVGRWWFGSRKYTKDGVLTSSAQLFFKNVREDTTAATLLVVLARAWDLEDGSAFSKPASGQALAKLEADVKAEIGDAYAKAVEGRSIVVRRALALLYAHLLRIHLQDPGLQAEQDALLVGTQSYLNAMLSMTLAHNWLAATLQVMHLHASLAQAVLPDTDSLLAFPSVRKEEVKMVEGGIAGYVKALEEKGDPRLEMVKVVADKWGSLELVDAQFKVIGERIVTPGAIVQLVVKLRLTPPTALLHERPATPEPTPEERKKEVREEAEKESAFLTGKEEADTLLPGLKTTGYAHSPYWPLRRKPTWWMMIGDQKLNRVIVPPIRISEVPYADTTRAPKDYRAYKLQFQAPPQVGVYTFQIVFVSDTFVGDDVRMFLPLKVEDISALSEDEQVEEDEISDPDEDTLEGQMAIMKGGKVKRSGYHDDDDESSTNDDESSGAGDSSSDSDSD